jgi:hypothetical protein
VFAESSDDEQIIERVAALDIGKAEIVCCIRLPAADGERRVQEVSTHSTMVPSLCELANRLVGLGVQRVVMEATSDYWRPPFYLFEAHGLEPWLVNAKDVKHLPGRPKTDRLDAVWLCKVAERQMLRPRACQGVCVNRLLILWLGRGSSALDGVPVLAAVKLGGQVRLGGVLTAAARRRCWPGWRNPAVRASLVWLVTRSLPTGRGRPG